MTPQERAARAVEQIERDISDRRGLKWEWNGIDDEVKAEIRKTWTQLIVSEFESSAQAPT